MEWAARLQMVPHEKRDPLGLRCFASDVVPSRLDPRHGAYVSEREGRMSMQCQHSALNWKGEQEGG